MEAFPLMKGMRVRMLPSFVRRQLLIPKKRDAGEFSLDLYGSNLYAAQESKPEGGSQRAIVKRVKTEGPEVA